MYLIHVATILSYWSQVLFDLLSEKVVVFRIIVEFHV